MRALIVLSYILQKMRIPCIFVEQGSASRVTELTSFVDVLVKVYEKDRSFVVRLTGGAPDDFFKLSLV